MPQIETIHPAKITVQDFFSVKDLSQINEGDWIVVLDYSKTGNPFSVGQICGIDQDSEMVSFNIWEENEKTECFVDSESCGSCEISEIMLAGFTFTLQKKLRKATKIKFILEKM